MGRAFTLKTFAAVTLLSTLTSVIPLGPASRCSTLVRRRGRWAADGTGFLVLFRHHASLGGLNILVLVLQKRFGWRAGWVQMGIDGTILIASLAMIEPKRIAMSILGALALNLTLALNHRPGRYVAFLSRALPQALRKHAQGRDRGERSSSGRSLVRGHRRRPPLREKSAPVVKPTPRRPAKPDDGGDLVPALLGRLTGMPATILSSTSGGSP